MRYFLVLSVATTLFVVSYAGNLLQGSVNIFDAVKGRIEVGVPSGISLNLGVGMPSSNDNANKMEQNSHVPAAQPVKRMNTDEEGFK